MSEVTRILNQIENGDPSAAEQLLPLVYEHLKNLATAKMASERPDHTLLATALVHEAYLRLFGPANDQSWNSRGHFFAAAAEAMQLWQHAIPVLSHPYLQRKKVQPHGIRQSGDALIIPMYRDREIRSVQRIYTDGRKRFLKDGDIYATYYAIGKLNGRLWIAEGFATAASVYECTETAVACAFSGLNMAKVAMAFRKQYPDLDIRIAGDAGGEKYADEAMIACLGKGAIPVFDNGDKGSDWNDFFCLYGKEVTRENLNAGI